MRKYDNAPSTTTGAIGAVAGGLVGLVGPPLLLAYAYAQGHPDIAYSAKDYFEMTLGIGVVGHFLTYCWAPAGGFLMGAVLGDIAHRATFPKSKRWDPESETFAEREARRTTDCSIDHHC